MSGDSPTWREQSERLHELIGLHAPPVAVTFLKTPPAGVSRIPHAGPSSCSYWKLASEGQTFYTEATDQYNCPVGAYTQGVDLPQEQTKELEGVVGIMVQLGYIDAGEVQHIPRREGGFGVALYAPLADTPADPDIVLFRVQAKQMMLLSEAARSAGASGSSDLMGRPTCAAIPAALRSGGAVSSLGCIGNRVYTDLADDEFYFVLPGPKLRGVTEKLASIVEANRTLEEYHRNRKIGNRESK